MEEPYDTPPARNLLSRALARWDNEGGAAAPEPDDFDGVARTKEDQLMLQRLGAAAIAEWNDLPTGIQRRIFERAIWLDDPSQPMKLKSLIARFLHQHKDDAKSGQ